MPDTSGEPRHRKRGAADRGLSVADDLHLKHDRYRVPHTRCLKGPLKNPYHEGVLFSEKKRDERNVEDRCLPSATQKNAWQRIL